MNFRPQITLEVTDVLEESVEFFMGRRPIRMCRLLIKRNLHSPALYFPPFSVPKQDYHCPHSYPTA